MLHVEWWLRIGVLVFSIVALWRAFVTFELSSSSEAISIDSIKVLDWIFPPHSSSSIQDDPFKSRDASSMSALSKWPLHLPIITNKSWDVSKESTTSCTSLLPFPVQKKPCWGQQKVKSVLASGHGYTRAVHFQSDDPSASYVVHLLADNALSRVKAGEANCTVGVAVEPPVINPTLYAKLRRDISFTTAFDIFFTYDPVLLAKDPRKFFRFLPANSWIVNSHTQGLLNSSGAQEKNLMLLQDIILGKTLGTSMIFSQKKYAPGHLMRHKIWAAFRHSNLIKAFGRGVGKFIRNKSEALQGFMFSVVVENNKDQGYYFSDKLLDTFLLGVIPIYWGSGRYIKDLFDDSGMLFFQTVDDLKKIMSNVDTPEKQVSEYRIRSRAVRCNFVKALSFTDSPQARFLKLLVGPKGEFNCNICPQ